jgi:hypothetical protein
MFFHVVSYKRDLISTYAFELMANVLFLYPEDSVYQFLLNRFSGDKFHKVSSSISVPISPLLWDDNLFDTKLLVD